MKNSAIEWTHHTFSPWWGCQRVSPGCEHCYAETFDKRIHGKEKAHWGPTASRRFFGDKHWGEPLKWNRAAEKVGERHRVFCSSMADVFEDRHELVGERSKLFELICRTQCLDWLLLTKRPENIERLMPSWTAMAGEPGPWPNIWLGTTVEDQQRANERIPALLSISAAVRFLSCEPLLEPVDLEALVVSPPCSGCGEQPTASALSQSETCGCCVEGPEPIAWNGLDWVIAGGESGHGARPMNPDWARSLRDQCEGAMVPFLFKQWGEHDADGKRVGKKVSGRQLDGVQHDGYPTPRVA